MGICRDRYSRITLIIVAQRFTKQLKQLCWGFGCNKAVCLQKVQKTSIFLIEFVMKLKLGQIKDQYFERFFLVLSEHDKTRKFS